MLKRFDRIIDWMIHALAYLFVIGLVAILALALTGLADRRGLDLAQLGKYIAMLLLFPLMILWFGGAALRLLLAQFLIWRARGGPATKKGVLQAAWLTTVAVAILSGIVWFALRIYAG